MVLGPKLKSKIFSISKPGHQPEMGTLKQSLQPLIRIIWISGCNVFSKNEPKNLFSGSQVGTTNMNLIIII